MAKHDPGPGVIYFAYAFDSIDEVKNIEQRLIEIIKRVRKSADTRVSAFWFEKDGKYIIAVFPEERTKSLLRTHIQLICVEGEQVVLDEDYQTKLIGSSDPENVDFLRAKSTPKVIRII